MQNIIQLFNWTQPRGPTGSSSKTKLEGDPETLTFALMQLLSDVSCTTCCSGDVGTNVAVAVADIVVDDVDDIVT